MIERIDHVGIVVSDLEGRLRDFTSALGIENCDRVEVPLRGVRVARLAVGEAGLELIEPVNEESRVAAFLRERGEGLHHLALRVKNLPETTSRLRERGLLRAADGDPREGAFGRMVVELPSESFAGVRIQLV